MSARPFLSSLLDSVSSMGFGRGKGKDKGKGKDTWKGSGKPDGFGEREQEREMFPGGWHKGDHDFGEGKGKGKAKGKGNFSVPGEMEPERGALPSSWHQGGRASVLVASATLDITPEAKGDMGVGLGPGASSSAPAAQPPAAGFGEGKGKLDVPGERLIQEMIVAERQHREASATSFYFLHASKVRDCPLERLPRLQDLRQAHPDWFTKKPIDMTGSLLGDYRENMVGVSHRWEDPLEPDTRGRQLAALKRYLNDHPEIEYVWIDFSCMPQRPRESDEEAEFATMLTSVNVIYIGMKVLILLDMSTMSRFWTQMEAWMSMQDVSISGLARTCTENRRYTIVPLHNANVALAGVLEEMWAGKSAQEAHGILSEPDVLVTNQSDKDKQLPKVLKLNETIAQLLGAQRERELALAQLARATAAQDASALAEALAAAEKADVAPPNLSKGRETLAALSGRS